MRSNRFVILLLIMAIGFTLLSSQVFLTSPQSNHHVDETCPSKSYSSSYTPHDAIWIQSNQEFRDQAALESWDGNGTADDPFIITGYSFNQETQPLRIWDTDVHWKFIDNIVDGVGDDIQCGTWIEDASNGAIIDCEFLNRHSGMVLMNAVNITITRNYIHDVRLNGLEIYGMMFDCEISDNVLDDCTSNGILLLNGMSGGNVSDNTITNCGVRGIRIQSGFFNSECCRNTVVDVGSDGISLGMVSSSLVSFNSISNASDFGMNIIQYITGIGMYLDYCQFSNVQMNEIFICSSIGLEVEHGENTTIYENTIGDCEDYALKLSANTEYFKTKFNVFLDSGVGCQI